MTPSCGMRFASGFRCIVEQPDDIRKIRAIANGPARPPRAESILAIMDKPPLQSFVRGTRRPDRVEREEWCRQAGCDRWSPCVRDAERTVNLSCKDLTV